MDELFRGFQVALDPKKLLLAAAGILTMAVVWWLLALVFYAPQNKRPMPSDFLASNYPAKEGTDAKEAEAQSQRDAWKAFKDAHRKWNLLHRAAGDHLEWTDAGDLAGTREEYEKLTGPMAKINVELKDGRSEAALREELRDGKYGPLLADKGQDWRKLPYGTLRTWPWFEDRGHNPYLLLTGQTGIPWEPGHAWEYLLTRQFPVLIEPLVKFLLPVVYLFSPEAGFVNRLYFLLVILATLAIWAVFGGAITRMAAVQVARNEKIGLPEAIRFVRDRYVSFLSAPLFPLAFVGVMVLFLMAFGLVQMIPFVGDIVIDGLLWWLPLLGGLAMAVVLVGLVGWP